MASEEKVALTVILRHDQSKNLEQIMEQKAWGAFRYEIYPAYDFQPIAEKLKKEHS